jgi:hypothetical protein
MSRHSASAYWREVRKDAFHKSDPVDWLQWGLPPVVTSVASWSVGVGEALSEVAKVLIALSSGLLVFALVAGIKVARSVFRVHLAGLATISRVEVERDDARKERDQARADLARSRASEEQTAVSQSNAKAIAEALQRRLQHVTHSLANKVKSTGPKGDEWKAQMVAYEHEIRAEMEGLGCPPHDIDRFWDFTAADLAALGIVGSDRDPIWNQRNQWAQFRINALRELIDKYLRLAGEK